MFIYIFGLVDVLAGVSLLTLKFHPFLIFTLVVAGLLVLKSLLYLKDYASWLDLISAFFIGLGLLGYYPVINYLFVLWLVQKGVKSFF